MEIYKEKLRRSDGQRVIDFRCKNGLCDWTKIYYEGFRNASYINDFFIKNKEGDILGYVMTGYDNPKMPGFNIYCLLVDKEHRGNNIGKYLLKVAKDAGIKANQPAMIATFKKANEPLIKFFRHNDFQVIEERNGWFKLSKEI